MYINKSQDMALLAGANITGLNHTLQQLITQLALYKLEIPGKVPKTENFNCFSTLITGTEQHENANYWYRITQKLSVICTDVVSNLY